MRDSAKKHTILSRERTGKTIIGKAMTSRKNKKEAQGMRRNNSDFSAVVGHFNHM
jgi:hypothetical protein